MHKEASNYKNEMQKRPQINVRLTKTNKTTRKRCKLTKTNQKNPASITSKMTKIMHKNNHKRYKMTKTRCKMITVKYKTSTSTRRCIIGK